MYSIADISLETVIKNRQFWNCTRPIETELMYFLIIDRFHDGGDRQTIKNQIGFGSEEELQSRCNGNLKGVLQQLNYIAEMGITSIWLNPFQQNNCESYHGYAIENFLEVDPLWGTKEELIELISKAHALNLRVFFDIVLNHTGDNWSYKNKTPNYQKGKIFEIGNWRYADKPIPSEFRDFNCYNRKGRIKNWEAEPEKWEGDICDLKDLIQDDTTIGKSNLQTMLAIYSYWFVLTDCDGFRIDAAKHIPPKWLNTFIREMKKLAERIGKTNFFIFAEIISNVEIIKSYDAIDGYLDFDFYFTSVEALFQKNKNQLSLHKTQIDALPIRFLDNHDQIGQILKKRIAHKKNELALLNVLKAFLLMPGIPCIYYGTEQGLKGAGKNDGSIRECMFDPEGISDIFDNSSVFYKTIQTFSKLRMDLKLQEYTVENCKIEHGLKGNCKVFQFSNLTHSKLIVYNLKSVNESVSVKLVRSMSRSNKIVVYLYTNSQLFSEVEIQVFDDFIPKISIGPYGFMVLDIGLLA